MRKRLLIMACLLVPGTGGSSPGASPNVSPPDVFLITIDTLRSDHVHCYGYENIHTPAIDGLAAQGIRFTQAFTPSPITNSSHASILTGLLPSSHGVSDFGVALAASHVTLAQLLATREYHTAAFIGAVILDSNALAPGFNRGFDFYDNFPEHATGKSRWGRLERRGADVETRAESWLNAHPRGSHFVWVHLYDPHDPYEPPAPYSEIYKDRLYDGEIAYADSALGTFLAYLKKQGWYDNSLIVLSGDHGEGLGEHHEDTHGIFLYDSTTHVPLLVKLPHNQLAGTQVEAQVRTIDIVPTILEVLAVPAPQKLDGASLVPLFSGRDEITRIVFGQTDYPLRFGWAPLRSVRSDGFKFIEAPNPESYDLRADPRELHNQYEPWNADVQKARKSLAELNAASPRSEASASAAAVPAGTIDELHALGYLGPADAHSSTNVPEPSLLPDPKDKIEEQNLLHAAMMASEDGQPAKAHALMEKLLQSDASSVTAFSMLGRMEVASGEYRKALEHLHRAHELHPDDAALTLDYARAQEKSGDLSGATATLQATLKANPNQFPVRLLLGKIYLRSGNAEAALNQFEEAVVLQPDNVEAKTNLSQVLIHQKKFEDAAELLEPLATSDSKDADVFALLAQAYKGLGKLNNAQRAAQRAKALQKSKN